MSKINDYLKQRLRHKINVSKEIVKYRSVKKESKNYPKGGAL